MIKNFEPRLYQQTILAKASMSNTLVVLPTGLGKTNVAIMLVAKRLSQYPDSKIMFLAPTKPLVEQHLSTFKQHLDFDHEKMILFTGNVAPAKRQELFKKSQLIFSTPQGLENDVISSRIDLKDVSLIIFDEAHRATGEYAYVWLAKQYEKVARYPKILALTASPGSDLEKINEVCQNLHIEEIEVKTNQDPDVKPYIKETKVDWLKVKLPESFKSTLVFLKTCYKNKLLMIKQRGFLSSYQVQNFSKTELLKLQRRFQGDIAQGDRSTEIFECVSLAAEALKVQHAIELLESQGIQPLQRYMEKLVGDASTGTVKAVKNLIADPDFQSAQVRIQHMVDANVEHPKMGLLKDVVQKHLNGKSKIIVFSQFRDTIVKIHETLSEIDEVKAKIFVGQAKKNGQGLSQKEQKQILDEFRNGEINVLCASSVAEEGLDIPKVDAVIFYEPVPSVIRSIQRRGRTGRLEKGRVVVLMAEGTRDEGYRWSAHHKEKSMYRTLDLLKKKMKLGTRSEVNETPKGNMSLNNFISSSEQIELTVDDREKGSQVIKELIDNGVKINLGRLKVGDYKLSSRCGVEFKSVPDFVSSILDNRLLVQVRELKNTFQRPLIIIEGSEDMYTQRNIHPNAIKGMLATITISYGVPILQTKSHKETASLLAIIAKREMERSSGEFNPHLDKPENLAEVQEYVVSSLPGVGPTLAKPLLKKLGSIKNIANANLDELKEVDKIGEKKAKEIQRVLTESYSS
ncbi:DEAD/DEAH box helicase family protein [Candidatus Woesearchaeota archaeon]|jgi:ERCC4-related helicase|nr:DEAD/DEAH box helicase family protein [Candidatus Woesearchaeota archaeon]MBT3537456.1 DEAD/DEAH box helicase family protein [Candidatus Woesearchaeota archaeon]MBT4696946.1 DEAD/DEAH box helicase family protein [Candidatus Woesearchaeota archaeon]MBT4717570.1 DEAD/DEAH box helicase family protein [Candidatus Woesearchaeota archaeon]MBT7106234.1 DEAD/DEAH box helicase family protein [Candidatus Woesearchaeota archaeon]